MSPQDDAAKKLKDLLGVDSEENKTPVSSKYPRLPLGTLTSFNEATKTLTIDMEAELPWVQVSMVDGEITSAKNQDGTDSDIFKP